MPPKASKERPSVEEEDEILQAVVLTDSFNSRFKPLSINKPRALLPLCNTPLLDWTLECLVSSGVQEIFVFCCSHADQIKEAIRTSRWSLPNSGVKITPIVTPEARSVGDVMRELDAKQIITSDFILVTGDVVSTIPIDVVLREHKERRKISKDAIMTMVMKPASPRDLPKPGLDASVLLLDSKTLECLHYEYVPAGQSRIELPRERITSRQDLDVRIDLQDCSIDVCSADVPALFTENFDYQDLRADFVHGVLTSDLLGKTIYCHIPSKGYAARVKDTRSYAAISQDVLSRRTFPLVPDDSPAYRFRRGHLYISSDSVVLSRTCMLGSHTQIGPNTRVEDDASIQYSVIGPNCTIGRGAVIRNSYIWANTTIGAGCVIDESIIGNKVTIGPNSRITRGSLIGEGTVLGRSALLPPFSKVSKTKPKVDDDWDEEEDAEADDDESSDPVIVGQNAQAYLWPLEEDEPGDDSDNESERETAPTRRYARFGNHGSDLEAPSSDESSAPSSSANSPLASPTSSHSSLGGNIASLSLDDGGGFDPSADFRSECEQSLERAFDEGHTVDNAAIELKTLRMASNVPLSTVKEVVVAFLVGRIPLVDNPATQKAEVNKLVERWGGLVTGIRGEDPVESILILQSYCATNPTRHKLFGNVLAAFYNEDIVEDEDIKAWILNPKSKLFAPDSPGDSCRKQGLVLYQAIQAQSSEEDDDDDDEESE